MSTPECTTMGCEIPGTVWGTFDDGDTRTRVLYCVECARDLGQSGEFVADETLPDLVTVRWSDCNCEWFSKTCDELHTRVSVVPRETLLRTTA